MVSMASARPAGNDLQSAHYKVINTFIEVDPLPEEQGDTAFQTWPLARPPIDTPRAVSTDTKTFDTLEDGELLEDGEVAEDGETGEVSESEDSPDSLEDGEVQESAIATFVALATAPLSIPRGTLQSSSFTAANLLASAGSAGHNTGQCKPCAWMSRSGAGCRNGAACDYCHLCLPGELKRRKKEKMQKRMLQVHALSGGQNSLASGKLPQRSGLVSNRVAGNPEDMEPRYVQLSTMTSSQYSVGSAGHELGQCRPCAWQYKEKGGCKNGSYCDYCHLCPPGELKRRKREKSQKLAAVPGSAGHEMGQCRPCAWQYKDKGGCKNGNHCNYCHLCPPGELKQRKREKWQKLAAAANLNEDLEEPSLSTEAPSLSTKVPRLSTEATTLLLVRTESHSQQASLFLTADPWGYGY
mmetsp:Transcript_66067/g.127614  ORF Transcript_66067/g.127614 Transcript_66067/m.127614 type:complete len:411 (+) Transcript_66067:57-1289(+)